MSMEELRVGFQGRLYYFVKFVLEYICHMNYSAPSREEFPETAVYVCRHSNLKGPILSTINLPFEVHPWAYHVWCDKESCRKQCEEYTFSVRFGWPKWKVKLVSALIAGPFSALVRSTGSIPVYRNSFKVRETFKLSIEALMRGENLLIFPDVDYTAQEGDAGALYEGFLMLERMYLKETGQHLKFVPIHISDGKRRVFKGETICFQDGVSYNDDKKRVIQALQNAMNGLMDEHGI